MRNPKDTAERLAGELDEVLDQKSMARIRRTELLQFREQARELAADLAHFDAEYVPLDLRDADTATADVYAQWNAIPAGTLAHPDPTLERLITMSAPLRILYRAGLTIDAVRKFDERETAFAGLLGDNFAVLAEFWQNVKRDLGQRRQVTARFCRKDRAHVIRLVDAIEKLRIAALETYQVLDWNSRASSGAPIWIDVDIDEVPKGANDRPHLRARLRILDRRNLSLITGEWLNAYATGLVHDHLRRNDIAHEVYSNIRYRAPQEIINTSGDFDVLAQARGRIAVIECKSGPVDVARGDLDQVIDKTRGLQKVIELTRSDLRVTACLLYISETRPGEVERALAGTGIIAMTPEHVRGTSMSIFGG